GPSEGEGLGRAARRDAHDAVTVLHRDLVPAHDAVLDAAAGRQVVERAGIPPADKLRTRQHLSERLALATLHRNPIAAWCPAVFGVPANSCGHVSRQR